jgi:TP901 family phage tail tape measure protein
MSKVKEDKSRVTLEVDGKQAINQLGKLEMEAKQLAIDMKLAKKGTQEYVDTNKKLKETEAQIKSMRQQLGLTGMTMTQLSRYQRELRKEIQNTTTSGTDRYKELNAELQKVNRLLDQQRKELNGTKGFFSDIKKELKSFAVLAVGALGVTELFAGVQNLIKGSAELSDAYADVQKTTGLTKAEVEALNQELKKMDTRTPRSELLKLAADAGKLGIEGSKNILDFVNGADKINVALGEDLGEDAIKSIGKLNELFGIREVFGYGEGMLKAGSAINELGASSTASESYIVGFTARLGGAAKAANITMTDIMGLAATLDSLGQQEETSSTAIGMFIVDMFKDTSTYANIAGKDLASFTKLLNEDANEALIQVLEGLNGNNEGFATMVTKLQEAGVEGSRGTQVISALAGNTKLLREQQVIANDAFTKGTSILEEFNTKNDNFAGNLEKIQKWMTGWFVNGGVMDALNQFVKAWADWIKIPVSQKIEDERIEMNTLAIKIQAANTSQEERVKLINKLKEMYPDYLGSLDAESTTNAELATAINRVNEQLINKIILQKNEEKLSEQAEKAASAKTTLMDRERELLQEINRLREKYGINLKEGLTIEEQALYVQQEAQKIAPAQEGRNGRLIGDTAKIVELTTSYQEAQGMVNRSGEKFNAILKERESLIKQLGVNMATPTATPANPAPPTPTPTPTGAAGATPDKDARAFAEGVESIFQTTFDKIEQTKALTIRDTTDMFDNLKVIGKEFGVDMEALAKERAETQVFWANYHLNEERKIADAKQMIAQGLSMSLGAAIDFIGNKSGELTAFQKILTVAQIAIDSAAALGRIVPLAAEAAAGTGPAAPFVFAGYVATMAGTVLGAIAKAKNALSGADTPEWNSTSGDKPNTGRSRPPQASERKSFYYGGDTGNLGIGLGDQYGDFTGFVHANEYVIPSMTVSEPFVANLLPAIEQIRQDNIRGFSSMGGMGMGTEKMERLLMEIAKGVRAFPKEIKGKWVITDLEEAQEEKGYLESRYRA